MVNEGVEFPTLGDAAIAVQPCVSSFDDVSSRVSTEASAIVAGGLGAVLTVRSDQFDALFVQAVAQRVAVIAAISDPGHDHGQWRRRVSPTRRVLSERPHESRPYNLHRLFRPTNICFGLS